MLAGTAGYGFLAYIEDDSAFLWISFAFRILQGFGDGCASTAIYSIIAIEFKEEKALYLSYFSAATGLGALLGPMIGQLIFNQVGFASTFFVLAGMIGLAFILQFFSVPNRVNKTKGPIKKFEGAKKITFLNFLTNKRALMACISTTTGLILLLFYLTIYSDYMINDVKVDKKYIGFLFGIQPGTFFVMAPIVGYFSKRVPRIYIAQLAFFTIPISVSLYGPSKFLGIPQKLYIMLPGNVCMGISNSLMLVPLIAEIIDAVKQKEKVDEEDEATTSKISDLASGLYGSCNALGSFTAPIVGGLLNE
jgi:MFS family permease